ncbi:MAG: hypothetical protein I3J02_03275 [Prevotella sp.]|nr:hypothetical protein [Prevotella sp.]
MAKHTLWHDEYWLLLMQLYLKRPQGVKPLYSRGLVDLALELHIVPEYLYRQMFRLRQLDTPRIQQLWDKYATRPKKLTRVVTLLRQMSGFGNYEEFYAGVEVNESWERDFKPVDNREGEEAITPAKLIMILDLYFRLVPDTMVKETPEVVELARLIRSTPDEVTDVMEVFRFCDPLLSHEDMMIHPLLTPCMNIWKRFGNEPPEKLSALAAQLKEYWK